MNLARRTAFVLVATFCVAGLCSFVAAADEPDGDDRKNVAVTIRVIETREGQKTLLKSYRLVIPDGGDQVEVITGSRVPIPTTNWKTGEGADGGPITSFTYQNVGFTAKLRAHIDTDKRIALRGQIEESRVVISEATPGQPVIETSSQTVKVRLKPGKPIEVLRVDDPKIRAVTFEIEAEVL